MKAQLVQVAASIVTVAMMNNFASAADTKIQIGNSAPLTGAGAPGGKDSENGLKLALQELNAKGVLVGGNKANFVLNSQDDMGDPRIAVQVAQKLIDDGIDLMVGPYYSGTTIPASVLFSNADIPELTPGTNPAVTSRGLKQLYRLAPSDAQLGSAMADYAATKLHAKKVAIIDDRSAYGAGVADEFQKTVASKGVQMVGREYTNDKAVDFSAILTTIRAKNPDAVFFGGYATQVGQLAKQMKKLGMKAILLGGDQACDPDAGKIGGDAADIIRCPVVGISMTSTPAGKAFVKNYTETYGHAPQIWSAIYYDVGNLIAKAFSQAGSTDKAKVNAAIRSIGYDGVAGHYAFDEAGNLKNGSVTVYTFKDGKPVTVSE